MPTRASPGIPLKFSATYTTDKHCCGNDINTQKDIHKKYKYIYQSVYIKCGRYAFMNTYEYFVLIPSHCTHPSSDSSMCFFFLRSDLDIEFSGGEIGRGNILSCYIVSLFVKRIIMLPGSRIGCESFKFP